MRTPPILFLTLLSLTAGAQSVEWSERQDSYQVAVGQTIRVPIRIRNTSDKPQFYIIRKVQGDLTATQKGYFCLGDDCLDPSLDQFSKRIEPGETLTNLYFTIEPGLVATTNSLRFEVFPKGNPTQGVEHGFSVSVEEKPAKSLVFQSRDISVHDIYPNPVVDQAFIDYKIYNETLKAKIVIHNILGSPVGNYELPTFENRVKIQADDYTSGVYFYTVYLDNVGVVTRKMVVRK